jgi:hypothetical protein
VNSISLHSYRFISRGELLFVRNLINNFSECLEDEIIGLIFVNQTSHPSLELQIRSDNFIQLFPDPLFELFLGLKFGIWYELGL